MKIYYIESGSRRAKIKAETKEDALSIFVLAVKSNRMQNQLGLVTKAAEGFSSPTYHITSNIKIEDDAVGHVMKMHKTKYFLIKKGWRDPSQEVPTTNRGLRLFNGKQPKQDGEKFVEMTHKTKAPHKKHTRNKKAVKE